MKKYISVLFVFAFIFSLLSFNVATVSASGPYNDYTAGCTSTQGYSPTTGEKCVVLVSYKTALPEGCRSTAGYSPTTGIKCDSLVSSKLPAGCTSTVGYSPLSGIKCDSVVNSSFPSGCTSHEGFSVTTGESCGNVKPKPVYPLGCYSYDGYSSVTGNSCHATEDSSHPVITGVTGPQSLSVNEQGSWSVGAYDPNNGSLSYSVVWGDEYFKTYSSNNIGAALGSQTATFTHSYSQAGSYNPKFTVHNNKSSADTSLSVNVGNVTLPKNNGITVTSPNGGESWAQGTTHTIKWQDYHDFNCGDECNAPVYYYDITLTPYKSVSDTRTIAKGVYGNSYDWSIPYCYPGHECSSNFSIPSDSYTIKVCQSGTNICDTSNSYFKVVDGVTVTQ